MTDEFEYFNSPEDKLPLAAAENAVWAIKKISDLQLQILTQGRYKDNSSLMDILETVVSSAAASSQQLNILEKNNKYEGKPD